MLRKFYRGMGRKWERVTLFLFAAPTEVELSWLSTNQECQSRLVWTECVRWRAIWVVYSVRPSGKVGYKRKRITMLPVALSLERCLLAAAGGGFRGFGE